MNTRNNRFYVLKKFESESMIKQGKMPQNSEKKSIVKKQKEGEVSEQKIKISY